MASKRKAFAATDDATRSRWVKTGHTKPKQKRFAGMGVESVRAGRSIFHRGVKNPEDAHHVLVSAHNNEKIGRDVRIGWFKGYWIYTLTLEERATCPTTCGHWEDCYGNNMPWAARYDHTDLLELATSIHMDLDRLTRIKPPTNPKLHVRRGVMVRLHALGDFFSVEYVEFWAEMLRKFPTLAIYGYTARSPASIIGLTISHTTREFGDRFRIRWSDGGMDRDCTVSIERAEDCPPDAFVCPEQLDVKHKDGSYLQCMTCGACWNGDKNVAFVEH